MIFNFNKTATREKSENSKTLNEVATYCPLANKPILRYSPWGNVINIAKKNINTENKK